MRGNESPPPPSPRRPGLPSLSIGTRLDLWMPTQGRWGKWARSPSRTRTVLLVGLLVTVRALNTNCAARTPPWSAQWHAHAHAHTTTNRAHTLILDISRFLTRTLRRTCTPRYTRADLYSVLRQHDLVCPWARALWHHHHEDKPLRYVWLL
jgi:hypothetical protein